MPLDVVRLRDSDIATIASGEGFRAAVMLWCAAWHQVPAASLPNDDRMLARLAGYGRDLDGWKEVKEDAIRGFVECSDGRIYHPEIAERAKSAWAAKLKIMAKYDRRLEMVSGEWAAIRYAVFQRDRFTCQYCGAVGLRLECDHVFPRSRGGKTELNNLLTACKPCNRSKGAKTPEEWRQ
jgi:hypothetical protein